MPNTTLAANAASTPIDRRATLGSLAAAAGALLAVPKIAKAARPDALAPLIAAHEAARLEFLTAIDALEAAEPDPDSLVKGLFGYQYTLRNGRKNITKWTEDIFERDARVLGDLAKVAPAVAAEGLAALELERDAAMARLDEAFAARDAAKRQWQEKYEAENSALLAICAHRCGSPDELARKFGYLSTYRSELADEDFQEAIFASLAPEALTEA